MWQPSTAMEKPLWRRLTRVTRLRCGIWRQDANCATTTRPVDGSGTCRHAERSMAGGQLKVGRESLGRSGGEQRFASLSQGPVNFLVLSGDGRWLDESRGAIFWRNAASLGYERPNSRGGFHVWQGWHPCAGDGFCAAGLASDQPGTLLRSWEFTADDGKHAILSDADSGHG